MHSGALIKRYLTLAMDTLHQKYHNHPYFWLKDGLRYGLVMFVGTSLLWPLIFDDTGYTLFFFCQQFVTWMIGGLGYGLLMRYVIYRKKT